MLFWFIRNRGNGIWMNERKYVTWCQRVVDRILDEKDTDTSGKSGRRGNTRWHHDGYRYLSMCLSNAWIQFYYAYGSIPNLSSAANTTLSFTGSNPTPGDGIP